MLDRTTSFHWPHAPHPWRTALAVALAYLLSAQLTMLAPIGSGPGGMLTVMWAPTGLAFACVWRYGLFAALGVAVGAFAHNLSGTGSLVFGVVGSIANLLPALFATWRLRRIGIDDLFATPEAVLRFAIYAGFAAPLLSASVGVLGLRLGGLDQFSDLAAVWLLWWAGDALAILLVAPALLTAGDWRLLDRRRRLEMAILTGLIALFWWRLFLTETDAWLTPLAVLTMPLVIAAALRFNFAVVAGISLLLALLSISAAYNTGQRLHPHEVYFYLLTFLVTLAFSSLVVSAGSATLRRTFARLTHSEERFRAMFEQAAVGFMLRDIDSGQRSINQKLTDMLGYTEAELPRPDLGQISFPEDNAVTHALTKKLVSGELNSSHQEKRYRRKDGAVMWASTTFSLLRDERSRVRYSIGVFEDITARKRLEAQLQGQSRILRALTLGAPLPDLLRDLALLAEELWPNLCCAIYMADNQQHVLYYAAAPSLPQPLPTTQQPIPIIDGVACTPTAAARRELVVAADMLTDPLWAMLRDVPLQNPWQRACWALPFEAIDGELLGVMTFYFDHVRAPDAEDRELLDMLSSLAGVVTQRHRDALKLRDSEQRFRITFQQAAVGVALLDTDDNWLQINQKFCDITGYSAAELQQMSYETLISPEDLGHARAAVEQLRHSAVEQYRAERRYVRKDGSTIWVSVTFSVTRGDDGDVEYQIAVIEDISERKRAEVEIERLALYDYLTGLPNRRLFGDRLHTALATALRSGQYGALVYIDLDNFKQLNDAHGHSAGDELLKMVATRLQRGLRDEDTVARLGGDEFVILLQNLSNLFDSATTAAGLIAEKIQQLFVQSFALPQGIDYFVTASFGITLFPKSGEAAEELLKEADIAMYHVKQEQRNAIRFYAPEMRIEADQRASLERDLRLALQRDEFQLYLQPQYDAERNLVGCEGLLRWPHGSGRMIPPTDFIPLAEETGLIVPLGEWVIRSAARIVHQLELAGYDITVSINVSPRQFHEANFVDRVRTILWENGADAGRLILEITEGIVVADFDDTRDKILKLRNLGIRLSIDDFGTGHSSLAYLKRLPLHELKIDRTFVADLPHDANDAALVEAILAVTRHLQLEVVAEGVETIEQFEFLKQRSCTRFQGYYLGRPQPPEFYFPLAEPVQKNGSKNP